jgi:hypothetical protein
MPVAASTTIYQGTLVALTLLGYLVPASADPTLRVIGRAEEYVDNSAGSAGAKKCRASRGIFGFANSSGTGAIVDLDVGRFVYAVDDSTVSRTNPIGQYPKGAIPYSGTGAGKYGPFLPMAAGDSGIRSIQQFSLSATYTSGVLNLVVCRPLLTLPLTTIGVAAERDLLNQVPSLPRVYDGANLTWLMYAGANTPVNSAYFGHLDFAWG